ncbi:MAG: response regulator transcription factor [Lachnospiraceae bacterium]|nr:response regulator transcription factor [Lachnospiraceae bacterium]
MIELAIVEDEKEYIKQLLQFVDQYQREYGEAIRVTCFYDGDEIVNGYDGSFDIILMDIQMKFMDGMSAAEEIRKVDQKVIIMFITNRIDYAIRGYDVDALDYIVKPVSYFSFAKKLRRAISRAANHSDEMVVINITQGMLRIKTSDLYYVESEGHNIIYHTAKGEFKVRDKMKNVEELLVPYGFFRSNKGYLVNLCHVDGVLEGCCLVHGQKLLISRARKNEFMTALTEYIGAR